MQTVNQLLQTKGNAVWTVTPFTTMFDALKIMAEKGLFRSCRDECHI